MMTRRKFMQLSASLGVLAGLGRINCLQAATQDYKALVCLFLYGGNDGHNLVVPLDSNQFKAYTAARGALALPASQLLPIQDTVQGAFGLHYGLPEMQTLYQAHRLAIVANVGMLVQPTRYADQSNPNFALPANLRSHADQQIEMQTGVPTSDGGTGWGGRVLDGLAANNSGSKFPVSISINSQALFCNGAATQGTTLQPGNNLDQDGLAGQQARSNAQQQIIAADSGNAIINNANQVMISATGLNPILASLPTNQTFPTPFPSSDLGAQLQEIANLISINAKYNVGRQVFFCSLGGFDTHSGQSWQQWSLLQQVSQALNAFYSAVSSLGLDQNVTLFTLSDFGRTLQPSGSGSDHGWGNHHLVLGGAANGGQLYGRFPLMTNYANFNASADDFADNRGVLLPSTSMAQYGATLARWFGSDNTQLSGNIFPVLNNFASWDLGFMA